MVHLGAPRLSGTESVKGLIDAPSVECLSGADSVKDAQFVKDLIDAPSVKDLGDVAFVGDLSGAESVKDLGDAELGAPVARRRRRGRQRSQASPQLAVAAKVPAAVGGALCEPGSPCACGRQC